MRYLKLRCTRSCGRLSITNGWAPIIKNYICTSLYQNVSHTVDPATGFSQLLAKYLKLFPSSILCDSLSLKSIYPLARPLPITFHPTSPNHPYPRFLLPVLLILLVLFHTVCICLIEFQINC